MPCDPAGIGVDICAAAGTNTYGHEDCYVAWDNDVDEGQLDMGNCDIGCWPCDDMPDTLTQHAAHFDGNRWLRGGKLPPNRDARGNLHDLRSNEYRRVPMSVNYERAASWRNDGVECWGNAYRTCETFAIYGPNCAGEDPNGDCEHPNIYSRDEHPPLCRNFGETTPVGDVLPNSLTIPDHGGFIGQGFPAPNGLTMQCRQFQSPQAMGMAAGAWQYGIDGFLMPILFRTGAQSDDCPNRRAQNCIAEYFTRCTGKVQSDGSPCLSSYGNSELPGEIEITGEDYYNREWDCRNNFAYLYIRVNNARFARTLTELPQPELDLKNIALVAIRERTFGNPAAPPGIRFDRLDYKGGLGKTFLGLYAREYSDPTLWQGYNGQIAIWPNCRFRRNGSPIRVTVHIARIRFVIGMAIEALGRHRTPIGQGVEHLGMPHARARIEADLYYHATCEGGPTIGNPNILHRLPEVLDDDILYQDELGRQVNPPLDMRWEGFLGHCGNVPSAMVVNTIETVGLGRGCTRMLHELGFLDQSPMGARGLYIGGWPYRIDSRRGSPASIYQGGLTVAWTASLLDTMNCND